MGCHAALEETGVDYTLRFIDFDQPWPEDYLALNPNRKLPTLIDKAPAGAAGDHGDRPAVIYQSAAILLYLAENHPEANLIPAAGSVDRGVCYQWLFFMAEMLQPSFLMYYYPERWTSEDLQASHDAVAAKAIEWIDELWSRLDKAIGDNEYFMPGGFSVCDLYMLPMAIWNELDDPFPRLQDYENLKRVLSNIKSRPAVQRMMKDHIRK